MLIGVMELRRVDTRNTLDPFKLLTNMQNTVLNTLWLCITAVIQRAAAVLEGAAAPSTEWLTSAMILRIASAMVDWLCAWRPWLS